MHGLRWAAKVAISVVLAGVLAIGEVAVGPSHAGAEIAPDVDVVVFGDSFSAGNGAGSYLDACFRSPLNYGAQFHDLIASQGFYANLACGGAVTGVGDSNQSPDHSTLGQVNDDAGLTADQGLEADLVFLSMGGNDAQFSALVQWCFAGETGPVSVFQLLLQCDEQFDVASDLVNNSTLIARNEVVLRRIHERLPNARVVLLGYPNLHANDSDVASAVTALLSTYTSQQSSLVQRLNSELGDKFRFFDRRPVFAGHEVDANDVPWLHPIADILFNGFVKDELYHPTLEGWSQTGRFLVAAGVHNGADFATRAPGNVVRDPNGNGWLVDDQGVRHKLVNGGAFDCAVAQGHAILSASTAEIETLQLGADADPFCFSPENAVGSIVVNDAGDSHHVFRADPGGQILRAWIPTPATFRCLVAMGIPVHRGVTRDEINSINESWPVNNCIDPKEVAGKIVVDPQTNASYVVLNVDGRAVGHHIVDTATFECLTSKGIAVERGYTHEDVASLRDGGDQPRCVNGAWYANKIVRSPDGYSYLIDASGWRHWIPTGGDYLCFTDYRRVSVVGLAWDQIGSIPERTVERATCAVDVASLVGKIMRRSSDGAAWYVGPDLKRHWVQDAQTWFALTDRGVTVVDGFSFDGANLVPEGAFQPRALSPNRYRNTIIRRSDGTAWIVDHIGRRRWIPDGYSWECYRERGYQVVEWNLTFEQANSIPEVGRMGYCLARWQAIGKIIREGSTGTSYYVNGSAQRMWIPDGLTFEALQSWGVGVLNWGLNWEHMGSLSETGRYRYAVPVWRVRNTLIRWDNGTVYYVDWGGTRHWVRDWLTVERLQERGIGFSFWSLNNEHISSLGEGGWQPRALAAWRVRNRVVRNWGGTAYFVTSDNRWHWISSGSLYNWLVSRYGFAGSYDWDQLNSLRHYYGEGGWAGWW